MDPSNGSDRPSVNSRDTSVMFNALEAAHSLDANVDNTGVITSNGAAAPDPVFLARLAAKRRSRLRRLAIMGAVILVGGAVILIKHSSLEKSFGTATIDASQRYSNITIPLTSLSGTSGGGLTVTNGQSLSVNGQLNVNNSLVLAPTTRPDGAVTGQLYYDQTSNQLSFYNGKAFVNVLSGTPTPATSINGATGSLTTGNGISLSNNRLSNSGVLTLQGEAGNVTLASGSGIIVSGTTISNSGLLSLGGSSGDIVLGNGLGISGNTLSNTGIISAVGAGSITVTNDGNGNITIDGPNGSGGGTVSSPGGTIGKIAKFTGVQTIADSLLSDDGTTVTVGGALHVTGAITFDTPLSVASGGTGANSAGSARTNLGAAASGANNDITSLSGLTTGLAVNEGGTGATNATNARTNLGAAASGANSDITSLSGLTTALSVTQGGIGVGTLSTNGVLVGNGTSAITSIVAGGSGQCLVSTAGAPVWQSCPGASGVASLDGGNGALTIANTTLSGSTITINDASTSAKGIASFNSTNFSVASGTVNTVQNINTGATPTFAGINTNSLTPTAALSLGATSQSFTLQGNASSTITATGGGFTTTVGFTGTPVGAVTYDFDRSAAAGTYKVCTTVGNCVGVGGGVTSAGGATNTLAKFTGSNTIGNSIITDNGSTVTIGGSLSVNTITPTGALSVGATSQNLTLQGATVDLSSTAAGVTNTLTFAAPSGSGKTITLPNASGTVAVSASGPLALDAAGNLTCPTCLTTGGSGGTSGVSSVNGLTGALTLQGSDANSFTNAGSTITVSDASSTVKGLAKFNATNLTVTSGSVNTIQDIDTSASPQFAGLTLSSPLAVSSGGTGAASLTSGGILVGNGTSAITSVTGSNGQCLEIVAGTPAFTTCPGSGSSVTSVDGLSGALTINNSTGSGTAITINDASTSAKGIASFNSTNFTVSSGAVNTAQDIAITSSPTFAAINTNTITPSAALTLGATGQSFTLQGNASSTITATGGGFTTTVGFTGTPVGAVTYDFDRSVAAGTYTICSTLGNCAGLGGGITGSGTSGTIAAFTGSGTIGNSLLSQSGGTVSVNGNLNLTSGNQFQINGSQISSSALSDATNLAKLNGTQTFTGGTNTFKNSADSTTAFTIQNAAGRSLLNVNTTGGTFTFGNITATAGQGVAGTLVLADGTNDNFGATLNSATLTGNQTISLPNESGTICLENSANCGFLTGAAANGSYIQLQSGTPGTAQTGNFNVSGTGMAGSLQAGSLDTTSASNLTIGGTKATGVTIGASGITTAIQGTTQVATINATASYQFGGTSGSTVTCSGGQFLQNQVVQGGIVTGGTCASGAAGGVTTVGALDGGTANANGATISGSTIYLQSASASFAGLVNTSAQTFAGNKTFNGSVLTSTVDTASAGTLNLGTTTANAIALGSTNTTTTIQGNLTADQSILINGTYNTVNNYRIFISGTLSSSVTTNQYGLQNQVDFNPQGASLNNIYGNNSVPVVSGSALNISSVYAFSGNVQTTSGYTGKITSGIVYNAGDATIGGSQLFSNYYQFLGGAISVNSGNTSGTINDYNMRLNGSTAAAGSGGTLNNYGIYLTQPSGSGAGTTNNYGLYIQGNGGGTINYSLYDASSAPTYFTGTIQSAATVYGNLVSSTTGYQYNGTPGSTTTCSGGQFLQNQVVQGGIVTGGSCASAATGLSGSGTSGTIAMFSGSGTNLGNSILTQDAGATTITVGGNLTVNGTTSLNNTTLAAGTSITITGGNTASRPASPTEGMLYYDTTTHSLLVYSNGKWQADRSTATKIVAMGNATGCTGSVPVASSNPDGADFVSTSCTSSQTTINSAISALPSGGGTVYLMEGTYIVDGPIDLKQNVNIVGSGVTTILKLKNSTNTTMSVIDNANITGSGNITISNLLIDGNKANNTSGTEYGIGFTAVTSQVALTISGVTVQNALSGGLYLHAGTSSGLLTGSTFTSNGGFGVTLNTYNNTISNNTITNNTGDGLYLSGAYYGKNDNNYIAGNSGWGINTFVAQYNTFSNNTAYNNTSGGMKLYGTHYSTASNNDILSNGGPGINVQQSNSLSITGNNISSNTTQGIYYSILNLSDNLVSGNTIVGNGGSGTYNTIDAQGSYTNLRIIGNTITTSATGYGIYTDSFYGPTGVYISGNTYSGPGTAVRPGIKGTVYANQSDGNGNIINSGQGAFTVGTSTVSSTLSIQGGETVTALSAPAAPTLATAGTAGSTSYSYAVTALDGIGETLASTATSISTGNATLNGTNYIKVTFSPVSGAVSYKVYRTASGGSPATTGYIGTVTSTGASSYTFNDTGLAASGSTPATNTTGGGTFAGVLQSNSVNSITGFSFNGTAGSTTTCSGGNVLQNAVVQGGIITGGSCVANGGTPTLQNVYNNSGTTPVITLNSTGKGILIQDASTSVGGNLFAVQSNGGATNYLTVTTSGATVGGTLTVSTAIQAPSLDTASAGALTLGGANATSIIFGSSANGVTFTASGGLVASGTAQHTKSITLNAEYAGAVLDAQSDATCTSNTNGTMTSGYDTTSGMSYYTWTSTAAAQCYDVVVRATLPAGFNGWTTSTPLTIQTYTSSTSTGLVNVDLRDTTNTDVSGCSYVSATPGSTSTWTTSGSGCNFSSGTFTAGGTITLRIRMTGNLGDTVRIGDIIMNYQSKF